MTLLAVQVRWCTQCMAPALRAAGLQAAGPPQGNMSQLSGLVSRTRTTPGDSCRGGGRC